MTKSIAQAELDRLMKHVFPENVLDAPASSMVDSLIEAFVVINKERRSAVDRESAINKALSNLGAERDTIARQRDAFQHSLNELSRETEEHGQRKFPVPAYDKTTILEDYDADIRSWKRLEWGYRAGATLALAVILPVIWALGLYVAFLFGVNWPEKLQKWASEIVIVESPSGIVAQDTSNLVHAGPQNLAAGMSVDPTVVADGMCADVGDGSIRTMWPAKADGCHFEDHPAQPSTTSPLPVSNGGAGDVTPHTEVKLKLLRDCWFSTEVDGHTLQYGHIAPAGYELTASGADIHVRSGCPGGIEYTVNGVNTSPVNEAKNPKLIEEAHFGKSPESK